MRIRLVAAALGAAAAVSMGSPASANPCDGKLYEKCQEVIIEAQNLVCYLFEKCL